MHKHPVLESIAREKSVTPGESAVDGLVKKKLAVKLYREKGSTDESAWSRRKPEGPYEYAGRFRCNDHGKPTKAAQAVQEMMTPAWKIGTERAGANPAPTPETPKRGAPGIYARMMTEKEAALFCERCEMRLKWCVCR